MRRAKYSGSRFDRFNISTGSSFIGCMRFDSDRAFLRAIRLANFSMAYGFVDGMVICGRFVANGSESLLQLPYAYDRG